MRRVLIVVCLLLVGTVILAGAWLYTPDKDRGALEAQYAGPPSTFVEVLGVRLHVRDTGAREGPALVMLHGFGSSLQTWDSWAAALEGRYRVVRLDLPGFGLTGADPSGDYSDERAIGVIAGLMDRLGIGRATLVGNSMGGNIAWRFAAALPGRTAGLVLVSPAGYRPPGQASARPARLPLMVRMMRYVLPGFALRQTMGPSYADPATLTDVLVARYRDMLLVPGVRDAILARMVQTSWPDPVPILRTVRAPTLLLWGDADRLIPVANAQDFLAALPDARLVVLPGAGHVPQEEEPERSLVPLLAFLEER